MITFEDFQKLDLRVGKILEASRVENSTKLLKLRVDLGDHTRQILAGLGNHYAPEDLTNKEVVVVANLAPRVIMGLESQGMLLAADNTPAPSLPGGPVVLIPDREIPPGSRIH